MILRFYTIYNKLEMMKIRNQTREKSQVLLQVLQIANTYAADRIRFNRFQQKGNKKICCIKFLFTEVNSLFDTQSVNKSNMKHK